MLYKKCEQFCFWWTVECVPMQYSVKMLTVGVSGAQRSRKLAPAAQMLTAVIFFLREAFCIERTFDCAMIGPDQPL